MKFMQFFEILNFNFKKIFFITFFIIVLYEIFIKLKSIFDVLNNYLLKVFGTLLNHINYLHSNIEDMTILYFYYNLSCICYLECRWIEWYTPLLIPFSTINNISITVKRSNFTLVFCHANPGAERKQAGSSSYIFSIITRKFSNISANSNVSLWIYNSWYYSKFFFQNLYKFFLRARNLHQ